MIEGERMRRSSLVIGVIIAGALLTLYYFCLVSRGEMTLLSNDHTVMANAQTYLYLLQGRWDLDPNFHVTSEEIYYRAGKYYTYFGIFPALFRGMLWPLADLDQPIGRVDLLICALIFASSTVGIGYKFGLHRGNTSKLFWILILVLLVGSPIVYSLTPASVYQQAVLWGMALLSLFNFFFVRLVTAPNDRTLANLTLMGPIAAAGVCSRYDTGGGIVLALALLWPLLLWRNLAAGKQPSLNWLPHLPKRVICALGLLWLLCAASPLYVNFHRFGRLFAFNPLELHVEFRTKDLSAMNERGMRFKKWGLWRLDNFQANLEYYLVPHPDNFSSQFPFVTLGNTLWSSTARMDVGEKGYMPMVLTCPLLIMFSLLQIFRWRMPWNAAQPHKPYITVLAIANSVPIFGLLGFSGWNLRYHADWLPLFALLSLIFLYQLKNSSGNGFLKSKRFADLCLVLAVVSVYACTACYIVHATSYWMVEPESRARLYKTIFWNVDWLRAFWS